MVQPSDKRLITENVYNDGLDSRAPIDSPTFTGSVSGIDKTMVGLEEVDNTSDLDKPVSTAQQQALDLKAPKASPTFTGTVSGIDKTMVGLDQVDNTSDEDKPVSTATQIALDSLTLQPEVAEVGTVSPSNYPPGTIVYLTASS